MKYKSKKQTLSLGQKEKRLGFMKEKVQTYLFIAVVLAWPIVQFLVFWLYTNIQSIMLAFAKVDVDLNMTFNGLNNFKAAFADFFSKEDISLRRAFINSFTRYLATNIVTYTIPIIFGFIIFKKFPLSGIARYCVMLPSIISSMMTSLVFEQLVHSLPKLFAGLGIVVPDMLIDPAYSFQTMTFFAMWTGCTSCAIMYPNMFNSVDTQLHEAAEIDGCTVLKELWHVYIPCIWPTITTFVVTGFSSILSSPGVLFAFYGDQAPYETATYGYMVFVKSKFGGPTQYGYTAALSLMGVIIVYPLTLLIKYLMEKGDRINAN